MKGEERLGVARDAVPGMSWMASNDIIQFDTEGELVELVQHYPEDKTGRAEIAMNARGRTLRNHLYEHRVREIMEAVGGL